MGIMDNDAVNRQKGNIISINIIRVVNKKKRVFGNILTFIKWWIRKKKNKSGE